MKKITLIIFIFALFTQTSWAQLPSELRQVERSIANEIQGIFEADQIQHVRTSESGQPALTNWWSVGRATSQRLDFIHSISRFLELIPRWTESGAGFTFASGQGETFQVGAGHLSQAETEELNQRIREVRRAYQVIPDLWLTFIVDPQQRKGNTVLNNYERSSFHNMEMHEGFLVEQLVQELRSLKKLYETYSPIVEGVRIEPKNLVQIQNSVRLKVVQIIVKYYEKADLSAEDLERVVKDLSRGENEFKNLMKRIEIQLGFKVGHIHLQHLVRNEVFSALNIVIEAGKLDVPLIATDPKLNQRSRVGGSSSVGDSESLGTEIEWNRLKQALRTVTRR